MFRRANQRLAANSSTETDATSNELRLASNNEDDEDVEEEKENLRRKAFVVSALEQARSPILVVLRPL